MRIDELLLGNFRMFENQRFRFSPGFNLLAGRNGSGKTTILDGLSVAMGSWLLGMASHSRECKARPIERGEARLKCIQFSTDGHRSVRYEHQHPVVVQARGEVMGEALEWKRTLESQSGRTTATGASDLRKLAIKAGRAAMNGEGNVTLPLISYYGTGRIWQQPRDLKPRRESSNTKASMSRLKGYLNSHDPRSDANSLFRWIQTQEYIALQEGGAPELDAVRKAVLGCIEGGKRLYFSVKMADLILEIEGQERQPFNNLSDGYRNMIAMVGDIAWKAVQLNPHLGTKAPAETPGIVLIDELDLHLHPTWQRRVIEDLRRTFPRIQFICTTHSPQVLGEAPPGSVWMLEDENGRMSVWQPDRVFGMDSNRLLEELMGADSINATVKKKLHGIGVMVDREEFQKAEAAIAGLESQLGRDHPELIRLRALISFLTPGK